ncbi:MAG: isoaspartyl peptidase/L-asparaginase-like protein (Ntn-hydrolase superfamily) [Vicingaceae bacterium]|jgi:isoaspartyl peptidase/L-asparaginase-like protein (Ntn-hydrolase superfamily)
MKRRTFLSSTALASLGVLFTRTGFASTSEKDTQSQSNLPIKKPVVVSTWIHGMEANKAAWALLKAKKSALDAVEQGVRVTESDVTNKSVGIGGNPDRDGNVTLDACIMNHESECGAVAYLQNIENPISVARKVMEDTPHVMLVGKGAEEFAYEKGFPKKFLLTEERKAAWEKWKESENLEKPEINHENHDTIGMLAIDENGNISGACTTSGWAYKLPGRVGDSPIIGAGLFVDNEIGAACATGMGEAVIRIAGSHTVVELMRQGKTPNEACKLAVERIIAKHKDLKGLQVGFLALNKNGEAGAYSTYAGFNYAYTDSEKAELIDAGYEMEW